MLDSIWTDYLLEQLGDKLRSFEPPSDTYAPLPDKWIALSLLQKAIRRGDPSHALRAALHLFHFDYRVLWRRLVVIGWEDISVGNPDLCFTITAAAGSKRWREKNGGDWHCVKYLTVAMCNSIKDRTIDDMMDLVIHGADYEVERDSFFAQPYEKLQTTVLSSEKSLSTRIIAAWYMCGTDRYGFEGLRRRKGDKDRYFHSIVPELCGEHVASLCKIGVSRSSTVLPIFLPLFWKDYVEGNYTNYINDEEVPTSMMGSIPRYAYDGFTRAGRRYLKKTSRENDGLRKFLNHAVPTNERDALIRDMYFRLESGHCTKRLDWPIGITARKLAGQVGYGLNPQTYKDGLNLLREACLQNPITEADL